MARRHSCAMVLLLTVFAVGQTTAAQKPAFVTRPDAEVQQLTQAKRSVVAAGDMASTVMAAIFDYQKAAAKEAQQGAKSERAEAAFASKVDAAKFQNENKQIERQMDEAAEKAQAALDAADTELPIGVASLAAAALAPVGSYFQSVETMVRGLSSRPLTSKQGGPNLDPAMNRFRQLQKRLAATSKRIDDELKKKKEARR